MALKIFVSHSSKYSDLAISLKRSLEALEAEKLLDIRISAEMTGATDWRKWIEENVRSSDVFLLLYPHAAMEMGWCNYELGRFYDRNCPIICIRNTDIPEPPPAFDQYQAYDASPDGLYKFLKELFADGEFSNKVPLNALVDKPSSEFHSRARGVCKDLAAQFAEARVQEHFYERRIVITLRYDDGGLLDRDKSVIRGNADGLTLLGLAAASASTWSKLKDSLETNSEWLTALEAALPAVLAGQLPPLLPPYRAPSGLYLPIMVKAETADGFVRQLAVIFVPAGVDRLLPMLGWSMPAAMPQGLAYFVRLVRSMFRSRWEVLEPRYLEAHYKSPSAERCAEIGRLVIRDYDQMQLDLEKEGNAGLGMFFQVFHKDLHSELDAASEEWIELTKRLRDGSVTQANELSEVLKSLLTNNSRWLSVAATQFSHIVSDLH